MRKKLIYASMIMKGILLFIMIVFGILGFEIHALAQGYPVKPITIVCGTPAGGINEMAQRVIGNELKKLLGEEILVICKPGAGGALAMGYVISMPPDGYILGAFGDGIYVRTPYFIKLNFNPMTDSIPIIGYGALSDVIIARGDSPFKTFKDAINFAKENPGKLTSGHMGIASAHYMLVAGLALQMGLDISMVPFKGDSDIILAVLGGHVTVGVAGLPSVVSHVKAGKLKLLAATLEQVREKFPGVPTFQELGLKETLPPTLFTIYGSKGLPDPIVKKLEDSITKACESAEFKKFAWDNDFYAMKPIKGQELRSHLTKSYEMVGNYVQKLGLEKIKP